MPPGGATSFLERGGVGSALTGCRARIAEQHGLQGPVGAALSPAGARPATARE
jgi:hypothetical protein